MYKDLLFFLLRRLEACYVGFQVFGAFYFATGKTAGRITLHENDRARNLLQRICVSSPQNVKSSQTLKLEETCSPLWKENR
jgi:hypothetical protein